VLQLSGEILLSIQLEDHRVTTVMSGTWVTMVIVTEVTLEVLVLTAVTKLVAMETEVEVIIMMVVIETREITMVDRDLIVDTVQEGDSLGVEGDVGGSRQEGGATIRGIRANGE
jgi:hypothetical protein